MYITELKVLHTSDQKYGIYRQKKVKNIENLEHFKKELKHGNLIISHVGCVNFTLKA